MSEKSTAVDISSAFELFDIDKNGVISFEDLKQVALELNENMTDEELEEMLNSAGKKDKNDGKDGKEGKDGPGGVTSNDFFNILNQQN